MKTKSKCIGCQAIKLVNTMGLCKRCNTHAHDFISAKEMTRLRLEREELLAASSALKKAKKEAEAAKAAAAAEAAEAGEEAAEEGEAKEEGAAEAGTEGEEESKGEAKDKEKKEKG
jgi:hypothetical protein